MSEFFKQKRNKLHSGLTGGKSHSFGEDDLLQIFDVL